MEEKIIDVAKDVILNTQSFCNKYDVDKESPRGAKIWQSAYDEIEGMMLLAMELLGCEVDDYPITYMKELQDTIKEK